MKRFYFYFTVFYKFILNIFLIDFRHFYYPPNYF